ncbi:MAG TPA: Ig-like domain-containing protein, partial [Anaerolineales bacterium]|nr:Ig-like domain-containing protein [Anaerolineales bacterium]
VDTVSPNVGLDVIGSNGANNWYVSPTTITVTGSDSTSGLSSILLSVNGGAWTASTTLNDGIYAVDVRAEDNAGNVSNSSTAISVDTVTPSVSLNVNGTMGSNGWYSSNMEVTASASDLTSGVASLEVSTDGGVYQAYTSPVTFTDGYHTIQFKATDNAGNQTETPMQEFYVDATAPAIDLPTSWEVNKTIEYNIQDAGSGLATLRIVIEDEDEKYKKVAWDEDVSGNKFKGEITWNGKFRDGTIAPPGEYLVWVKAKDQAGNERFGLGKVIIPQPTVFSLFQPATTINQETLLPPQELFDEDDLPIASSSLTTPPQISFGGSTTETKETTQNSLSLAMGTAAASATTNSNILWGATAAAMVGAMMAYALDEKRKRKEQEANKLQEDYVKAAKLNAMEEQRKINSWLEGQAMLNAYIEEAKKQGATDTEIAELREQGATQGLGTAIGSATNLYQNLAVRNAARNARIEAKMTQVEAEEDKRWEVSQIENLKRESEDAISNTGLFFTGYHLQGNTPPTPMPDGFEVVIDPSKRTIFGPPDLYDIFFRQDIKNDDPRQYGNLNAFLPGFGYSARQTNLCGQIVVAALTSRPLNDILKIYSQEGTGAERLRNNTATRPDEITRLINSQPGWSTQLKGLDGNDWIGGPSSSPSLSEINNFLDDGKKVIALVKIDSNEKNYGPLRLNGKTGHWVSIQDVDVSNQKVQIYNPFNDQEQIYNWENFKDAWRDEGSHTIYNYVAVVANPPVISTSPVYPTSTPIFTPPPVPSPQPVPTNTQTVMPSQQSEPSIWKKIWNWFKGLEGK